MIYGKKIINFKFILLSSALMLSFPAHAQFGPGGTTLSGPYTNNTTINSQGFLTMSGSGAIFTNSSGANFNNTSFTTTMQNNGSFNNSGTADLGVVSILSGGKLTNNAKASLTAGDTTILGQNSRFDNTGTATLASLNSSNTDVNNISKINNNTGGNLSVIGDTTLGFATLDNYGTMNLNTLTAKEFTVFGAYAGSITNISGVATLSGSDTDMFNNGKMSFGNNLLLNSGASIINNSNGNMSVTGGSLFDQASFDNKGITDFAAFTAQNGSYYTVYSGATTNINGAGIFTGNTLMVNSGISNFNDTLVVSSGTRMNNGSTGKLNVIGTTIIDSSTLNNNGMVNVNDLYVQNGATLKNTQNANLTSDGTTTVIGGGTTMVNAGTSNLNNLNIADNAKVTNNNILNATGATTVDNALFENSYTANLTDLMVQNGGTLNQATGGSKLTVSGNATIMGSGSSLINAGIGNFGSLNIAAGGTMTNNEEVNVNGDTIVDNATYTNASGISTLLGLSVQNAGNFTNNSQVIMGDLFVKDGGIFSNDSGIANAVALTMTNRGIVNNNTGGTFTAGATSLVQSTINNSADMTLGDTKASDNSLFTNDTDGKLAITGDLTTSNSQILNKGTNFTVGGTSTINTSTFNNYSVASFDNTTLTNSTFNSYAGSKLNSGNFNLNTSNFNMTASTFDSTGVVNIGAGSLYSVDSGLGKASTSVIKTSGGLNVLGTLSGSTSIEGNVVIGRGGVLSLLTTDYMNVNGDITFQAGSTYYTTINVRDPQDVSDQSSLINDNGHTYNNGMIISVGANVRPYQTGKKYAILVTDNLSETSQTLDLRDSVLTGYTANWEQTGPNEYTLFVEIDTSPIKDVSGLTYNEKQVSELIATLTPDKNISSDLNDTLDFLHTQVRDKKTLTKIFRGFSMETTANYLNYMPTLNRMMSQGAESRLNQTLDNQEDPARHLWVTPFASKSKQDHSKDVLNLDVQGFDADIYGISAGADNFFGDYLLGVMISYGNVDFKGNYTQDKITSDAAQIGLYAARKFGSWFAKSKASYTHLWNKGKSVYNLLPTNNATKGKFDTDVYAFDIKGGYEFKLGRYNLSPSVGVDVVNAKQEEFTETGAGGLSRKVYGSDLTSVELPVKLQLDWVNSFDNGINLKPRFYVEYAREVGDDMVSVDSQFVGYLGSLTTANSMYNNKNRYTLGTEIVLDLDAKWDLALKYNADFRKDYTNNSVMMSFEYNF